MATTSVYQMVTDRIIAQMEKGIVPWQKPWGGVADWAISYESRKPYSLINQFLLEKPGEYLTWTQIKAHEGTVKKGAKSKFVVFFSFVPDKKLLAAKERKAAAEGRSLTDRERKSCTFPVLKYYTVFHIEDTEGIESKIKQVDPAEKINPIETAEQVINAYLERETTLKFQNDKPSGRAFYSPTLDEVVVPMLSQFQLPEEYYSTAFHEFTHSTIPASRCNRVTENANAFFGNHDYSREELVAEIGAAMLCSHCGIESKSSFRNSIAYLQNWLKALKNDNKMIVWVAARAEKAARYILGELATQTE